MIFKKVSHGILVAGFAFAVSISCTSHAAANGGASSSDNQTLTVARSILGTGAIIIGASKIYANKASKTKQQKRNNLIGVGYIATGVAAIAGPQLYARIAPASTQAHGLITRPGGPRKALPPIPAPKPKHEWKQWFNAWLDKFK